MTSIGRFNQRMRTLADRAEHNTGTLMKQAGFAALRSVLRNTPVDEGVARSNWRVGIGRRPRGVIRAYAPGSNLGRQEKANEGAALQTARSRLAAADPVKLSRQTLFIRNNTPYLPALNNGSSRQSPAGFVERGVDIGRRRARRGITLKRKVNFR